MRQRIQAASVTRHTALAALLILMSNSVSFASAEVSQEFQIKAVVLERFITFVQTPAELPDKPPCVYGNAEIVEALTELTSLEPDVHGVRRLDDPLEVSNCSLVFLGAPSSPSARRELLSKYSHKSVVTVSDQPGFAEQGGMIELTMNQGKVGFIINRAAAEQAGITFSSQLLALAKQVL
jgi:hypothetical protein